VPNEEIPYPPLDEIEALLFKVVIVADGDIYIPLDTPEIEPLPVLLSVVMDAWFRMP
jgi:hypothetical protein